MKNHGFHLPQILDSILQRCVPMGTEVISIRNSVGRILAEDVDFLKTGYLITPMMMSHLLLQGQEHVTVYRRVQIGVFVVETTGEDAPTMSGINQILLSNALAKFDFSVSVHQEDSTSRSQFISTVQMAAEAYDAIIVIAANEEIDYNVIYGRVSDLTKDISFDEFPIHPGGFCCSGYLDSIPLFGLAGNTKDILTALHLIMAPVLLKRAGYRYRYPVKVMVELAEAVTLADSESDHVLFGIVDLKDGTARMKPVEVKAAYSLLVEQPVKALTIIPAEVTELRKGTLVSAYILKQ